MTNSRRFQLDYELDSVGPEGVDEVQLWGSTDYGQTWVRWSLDEDLRSPLDVQVEREGIYGFRVVIVGRNGLATPAPHTGDLADIWVGVDTTRPAARISSAIYGEGVHAGELDIRWEVVDESLGDRAITLLFSEQPSGPWTTIAAGLPNAKQYFWSVDPNTPRLIYLRLEVHDEAGNTAEHQLVEPISTTGLVPKAFIRSVRPVPRSPKKPSFATAIINRGSSSLSLREGNLQSFCGEKGHVPEQYLQAACNSVHQVSWRMQRKRHGVTAYR